MNRLIALLVFACVASVGLGLGMVGSDAPVAWADLTPGQIVEFELPGGWWHEGEYETGEAPAMRTGKSEYTMFVMQVEPLQGVWLAVHRTLVGESGEYTYGRVMTIPADLANTVTFDVQESAP